MNKKQNGFGIIEIIVAMAIFIIIAGTALATIINSFNVNRLSQEETFAENYTQEGVEAVRSLQNRGWSNLVTGTHGLSNSGGSWAFSGTSDISGKFTRTVTLNQGQRDANGNIVDSGGTADLNLRKLNSSASWNFSPSRSNSVNFISYLVNFRRNTWFNPNTLAGSLNISGNGIGYKIAVQGNYAYIVRTTGSPNFVIVDITNPNSPIQSGSLSLVGVVDDIAVTGNYAYIAGTDDNSELEIIDISNPSSPFVAEVYNAAGNNDALSIYLVGSTVYLGRASGASDNFLIINASSPTALTLTGSLSLPDSINDIFVSGNNAYLAGTAATAQLDVINITNPVTPVLLTSVSLSGTQSALSINGFSNTVLLGRANNLLYFFDVTNPAAPIQLSTYNAGGAVNDISLGYQNKTVFLATANFVRELQVVDINTLSAPDLGGGFKTSGTLNGIFYDPIQDLAFCSSSDINNELIIVQP